MNKNCKQCGDEFETTEKDVKFYERVSPKIDGTVYKIPAPTLCPTCRMQRKMAFRNERGLYQRKCDLTGDKIITMYPPESGMTVYSSKAWWSDDWDPMKYGLDFDQSKSFLEQFKELYHKVPKSDLYNFDQENSDYNNYACHSKNCYLLFGSWFAENCLYGQTLINSTGCTDALFVDDSRYCYECVDCNGCYEVFYGEMCHNCSNSWFLYSCQNCKDCIGCTNLVNKQYYLFNKPSTKEEIERFRAAMNKAQIADFMKKFDDLKKKAVRKYMAGVSNQNVTGDFVYRSKNIKDSYVIFDCEDIYYSYRTSKKQKDSYDISGVSGGELMYDSFNNDFSFSSAFLMSGEHNADCYYCFGCYHLKNCFGCDGLRHKQYCILNKQYTKEEYEKLVPQIIENMKETEDWGEFLPAAMAPFYYNETLAQEFWPLTKEEALRRGWKWKEKDEKEYMPQAYSGKYDIGEFDESVVGQILACKNCGKNYKIVDLEYKFYKKMNLPLPEFCFDCRNARRTKLRNPMKLYDGKCAECEVGFRTTYSPNRPETVLCEKCYLKEVY